MLTVQEIPYIPSEYHPILYMLTEKKSNSPHYDLLPNKYI